VAATFYANGDFGTNNLRLWRPRTPDGRFRWMLYDIGHGWPDASYDTISWVAATTWEGMPSGAAFRNASFREKAARVTSEWTSTFLAPASAAADLDDMAATVAPAMDAQLARWCPGATFDGWLASMDWARSFAEGRAPAYRQQLRAALGLGANVAVSVDVDPPGSGRIGLTTLEVAPPFEGTFYAGVPATFRAIPEVGWAFDHWEGDATGAEGTVGLTPLDDVALTAVFVPE
jgi:hypothetical protein